MKFLTKVRPHLHPKPPIEDKVAFLNDCKNYIDKMKTDGLIEEAHRVYHIDDLSAVWIVNVDSLSQLWEILGAYPGAKQLGIEWDIRPLMDMKDVLKLRLKEVTG